MAAAAETRPILSEATNLPTVQAFTDNPEFDLLIACCADSSHERHANRIPQILARPIDWDRMLGLVDYHRVVPQVYRELSAFSHLVPAEQLDALRLRYQDNARKTLWFTAELVGMLNHLESAGIEALPYKGPVLAETLYGEVTQRQFGDLDILILPSDVPKAKATLLRLGYSCEPDLRQQEEPAYIATGCGYVFHCPAVRNLLDLQWRIVPRFYSIDFDVAAFLERADEIVVASVATQAPLKKHNETSWNSREAAPECSPRRKPWVENETRLSPSGAPDQDKNQPQPSLGRPMRTLRGEDLLLVLCVHAAKHVWVQLSWLCDIAQLAKSRQLDWNAIQNEASRLGIERIVNLNLLLAHKLLGSPLPPTTQKRSLRSANDTQPNCHSEQSEESAVARNHKNTNSPRHGNLQSSPEGDISTLADKILPIIEGSVHYDTESLPYFRLMLRLRERWQDRARFLWRLAVTPSVSEWSAVQLPKPLRPLYRLVRLSRLAKRLASAGSRTEPEPL